MVKSKKPAAKTVRFTLEERRVDAGEWKRRVRALNAWPNVAVKDWHPILEGLTRKELHHTDPLYQQCHKFVMNARARHRRREEVPPVRTAVARVTVDR